MISEGITARAGDMEAIADLLSSGNKEAAIMARYMATPIPREFELWLGGELERKPNISDLLRVVASLQAQIYACLVAATLNEGGDAIAAEAFCRTARRVIPEHAARTRAAGGEQ